MTALNWSLNEIDATCRKAARGIGLTWGLAEETGRAARWLSEQGLPGAGCAAALMGLHDGMPPFAATPPRANRIDPAAGQALCPISTGTMISDMDLTAAPLRLGPTLCPALLLPFIAATQRPVAVSWDGCTVGVQGEQLWGDVGNRAVLVGRCAAISVTPGRLAMAMWKAGPKPPITRATASALEAWAARTFAPATDESRRSGAGGADD